MARGRMRRRLRRPFRARGARGGAAVCRRPRGGAVTLPPAKGAKVSAVFGALFLCTEGGEPATVTAVSADTIGSPIAVRSAVRRIPAAEDRENPRSDRWRPNIAKYGDPFEGALRRGLGGDIVDTEGAVIDDRCAKRTHDQALIELMTCISVDRAGGGVSSQVITYESGGRTYRLTVPWEFVICGSQLDRCAPAAPASQPSTLPRDPSDSKRYHYRQRRSQRRLVMPTSPATGAA